MSENNSIVYTHLYLVINNLEIEVVDILTFKNNKITKTAKLSNYSIPFKEISKKPSWACSHELNLSTK